MVTRQIFLKLKIRLLFISIFLCILGEWFTSCYRIITMYWVQIRFFFHREIKLKSLNYFISAFAWSYNFALCSLFRIVNEKQYIRKLFNNCIVIRYSLTVFGYAGRLVNYFLSSLLFWNEKKKKYEFVNNSELLQWAMCFICHRCSWLPNNTIWFVILRLFSSFLVKKNNDFFVQKGSWINRSNRNNFRFDFSIFKNNTTPFFLHRSM